MEKKTSFLLVAKQTLFSNRKKRAASWGVRKIEGKIRVVAQRLQLPASPLHHKETLKDSNLAYVWNISLRRNMLWCFHFFTKEKSLVLPGVRLITQPPATNIFRTRWNPIWCKFLYFCCLDLESKIRAVLAITLARHYSIMFLLAFISSGLIVQPSFLNFASVRPLAVLLE